MSGLNLRSTLFTAVAGLSLIGSTAFAQTDWDAVEIVTHDLGQGLYMLEGAGGNIGVSVGDDGVIIIDDQFAPLTDKILTAIRDITDQEILFVINTHFHGDHTGGNENLAGEGAMIVAHNNVRTRLVDGFTRADGRSTPPAPEAALPVITFTKEMTLHFNGDDIDVAYLKNAHTDGDAGIHFKQANVVHMGDVFFNGGYPFVDLEAGGTLDGAIAAHDFALAHMDDDVTIIPGHGPVASKADLRRTVAMLREVRSRVAGLIADGVSEDDAVAADPLADLNETWGSFVNPEATVRMAYRSLTAE